MAYYAELELKALEFKSIGKNLKISDKASIYNHDQIDIGYSDVCSFKSNGMHILILLFLFMLIFREQLRGR